jgi:hypothetical protein
MEFPKRKIIIAIGAYLGLLIAINLLSIPFELEEMPEKCSDDSINCARMTLSLDISDSELNQAMEEWESTRGLTSSFEEGHIVDRTLFMQFPDDLFYENICGNVEFHSQSRLGVGDMGVNQNRLDNLKEFLEQYDWSGETCQ